MVSRQETARPLLTAGEVMQLPPKDELVLISGLSPIRAKKLRYYEDRNFTSRILSAPVLSNVEYSDKPNARKDDWSGQVRKMDERLSGADRDPSVSGNADEGGMQQQRHPSLSEEQKVTEPELTQGDLPGLLDEDGEVVADKRVIDRLSKPARVYGLNEALGPERDLLDGL